MLRATTAFYVFVRDMSSGHKISCVVPRNELWEDEVTTIVLESRINKFFIHLDRITKPPIAFVLRVLGAFGACWGGFSSVNVTRKQFFRYLGNDNLMDNPVYGKTALSVSIMVATIAFFVFMRAKSNSHKISRIVLENKLQEDDVITMVLAPGINNFFTLPSQAQKIMSDDIVLRLMNEKSITFP